MIARGLPVVNNPAAKKNALLFFHGLGDSGHGLSNDFDSLGLTHIRQIFPHAATNEVTINGGVRMPSWFDVISLNPNGRQDEVTLKNASDFVVDCIKELEDDGIPSHKIVLGGISQGGALALCTAFSSGKPLAGVIAFSCWLPLQTSLQLSKVDFPIFQTHDEADPVVSFEYGKLSHTSIKPFCGNAEFKTYKHMGHWICHEEMDDTKSFLLKLFPK